MAKSSKKNYNLDIDVAFPMAANASVRDTIYSSPELGKQHSLIRNENLDINSLHAGLPDDTTSRITRFLKVYGSSNFLKDFTAIPIQESETAKEDENDHNYVLTSDGLIHENWESIITIPSKIIEITETTILMECLIDMDDSKLEVRRFKKNVLGKGCKIAIDSIILVKVFEKPGKITYELSDGNNLGFEKFFRYDEEEYLSINIGKAIK